jgi:hypothetical protein
VAVPIPPPIYAQGHITAIGGLDLELNGSGCDRTGVQIDILQEQVLHAEKSTIDRGAELIRAEK